MTSPSMGAPAPPRPSGGGEREVAVPKYAALKPARGEELRVALAATAPTSIWVTTPRLTEIPFRERVQVDFIVETKTALTATFEVISSSPAGIGLELDPQAPAEAKAALAAWASGRPAQLARATEAPRPEPRPRAPSARPAALKHPAVRPPDHTTLIGHTVLVVEDDPDIARMFEHFLTRRGADVRLHRDGRDALEHLGDGGFDTVLLDWMLPKVSGMTILEQLRAHHKGIRVAIVSGVISNAHTRNELLHLGADAVFPKPVQIGEIARWIARSAPTPTEHR